MITTADFKKGTRFLLKDEPYQIVDFTLQSPTARGGNTLVKVKAKNLVTGSLLNEAFKSGTKFDEPDVRYSTVQYLYQEGQGSVFMDSENYEQFTLSFEVLGGMTKYLTEDLKIKAMFFNDQVINVEIPQYVTLEVTMVEPGEKGNTSSGTVMTNAELNNGMELKVPLNCKLGQKILVDTETDLYHQRA
jgi:elongation factor P